MVASWKDFKIKRRMIKIQSRTNLNGGELERIRGRKSPEKLKQRVCRRRI